jgi:hypothetical protein
MIILNKKDVTAKSEIIWIRVYYRSRNQLRSQVWDQFRSQVYNQLADQISDQIGDQIKDQIRVNDWLTWMRNRHDQVGDQIRERVKNIKI